jgi:hypothetical protein
MLHADMRRYLVVTFHKRPAVEKPTAFSRICGRRKPATKLRATIMPANFLRSGKQSPERVASRNAKK